jgi:Tfp pilus assembly protein FimT
MELIVAIGIFAVLAAVATPNAVAWLRNSQFNASVRDVKAAVEEMRIYAVKSNSRATIAFNNGTNTFQTTKRDRGTNSNRVINHTVGPGITFGTGPTINFNSRGMANAGATVVINHDNGLSGQVVVAMTGSVRIQ